MLLWLNLAYVAADSAPTDPSSWKPVDTIPIRTKWFTDVHAEQQPEYPRPAFARPASSWTSLNGLWQLDFENFDSLDAPPFGKQLPAQILVPYPIESSLSGLRQQPKFGYLWYRRTLPPLSASSKTVLLHIGACDWECVVYIGGKRIGSHSGGYTPFVFDVTASYAADAELLVGVYDPSDCVGQSNGAGANSSGYDPAACPPNLQQPGIKGQQPVGKQQRATFGNDTGMAGGNARGIKYTPTSGIWQTVWLEVVPADCYIQEAHITTAVDGDGEGEGYGASVQVTPSLVGPGCDSHSSSSSGGSGSAFSVEVYNRTTGAAIVNATRGIGSATTSVQLPRPARLWSPSSPALYGLRLRVGTDEVEAYAGVRAVRVLRSARDGLPRTHLNGREFYQAGVLGQGFYPESIYAAPTDAALEDDILQLKRLGFNMVRKHLLREPERWYHYAAVHGVVIWQDMPSSFNLTGFMAQSQFEQELYELVRSVRNYPAVVQFNNFNEGWGQENMRPYNATDAGSLGWQQFTAKMYHLTKGLVGDAMLVADATGGACACPQSQCVSKTNPDPLIPGWLNRGLIHGAGCYGDIQDQHGGRPGCLLKPNTSYVNASRCTPRPHLSQHGEPDRSAQNGEYGGGGFTERFWASFGPSWGCGARGPFSTDTGAEYAENYLNLSKQFLLLKEAPTAFSGGVYDCWTDVESECDGFLSYDRVLKVPADKMREANALLTAGNS